MIFMHTNVSFCTMYNRKLDCIQIINYFKRFKNNNYCVQVLFIGVYCLNNNLVLEIKFLSGIRDFIIHYDTLKLNYSILIVWISIHFVISEYCV